MTATKARKSKKTVKAKSNDTVLSMYLKDISRIPILSREEEQKTARAAAAGNKAARDKLLSANLRFVVCMAKKYQGLGFPLEDLISEGNIGLTNAAARFDAEKGCRFISYAVWWIRQSILSAICEKSRAIRLPLTRTTELIHIEQARKIIQTQHTPEAEVQEIAAFLDMEEDYINDLLNISREMVSLEKPVSTGSESSIGEFLEATQYAAPDQIAEQNGLEDDIESLLNTLDEREAFIIRTRYGIGDHPVMSLQEIGEHLNISKERVRQIEQKALNRLQNPIRKEKLKMYVA